MQFGIPQVFAAGFSYGAATSALSVVRHPNDYTACILLDGWFSIDLSDFKSANSSRRYDFPPEAHEAKLCIPSLFIGSETFSRVDHLADATRRLAQNPRKGLNPEKIEFHVLAGTKHHNFCELGFWIPPSILQKLRILGKGDFLENYGKILDLTFQFLESHSAHASIADTNSYVDDK